MVVVVISHNNIEAGRVWRSVSGVYFHVKCCHFRILMVMKTKLKNINYVNLVILGNTENTY